MTVFLRSGPSYTVNEDDAEKKQCTGAHTVRNICALHNQMRTVGRTGTQRCNIGDKEAILKQKIQGIR